MPQREENTSPIPGDNILRFVQLKEFLGQNPFPSIPRVDKTRPDDNSPYCKDEVMPPETIYFRSRSDLADILNSNLVVAFIGAADKYEPEKNRLGCTPEGRKLAANLAEAVVEYDPDAIIVSGGANFIDRCSHRGAIKAGGRTISVVQNPVKYGFSPKAKRPSGIKLQDEILQHGGFVSEKSEYSKATSRRAMTRNYITSALSDIVIVVECWRGSGTIDNALKAVLQGKTLVVIDWDKIEGESNDIRTGNAWLLTSKELKKIKNRQPPLHFPNTITRLSDLPNLFKQQLPDWIALRGKTTIT